MGKFVKTERVEKAFYKSAEFQRIVRVGAAAYKPRLTGGFERVINQQQGTWQPNSPQYARWKANLGLDRRTWVRTGRTLAAMNSGKPVAEGTKKGVRFKITPGRFLAIVRISMFGGKVPGAGYGKRGGKAPGKPNGKVQKKIFKNMNYGIDKEGKAAKEGRAVRSRTGRVLSGFPGRPLFEWQSGEMKEIRESVQEEVNAIFDELGLLERV